MNPWTRSGLLVLLGLALLVVQSALASVFPLHPFVPNLILPVLIYLGVSPEVHIVRGALLAFFLGYLYDLFCGNLMSLQTFVAVSTFMLARGAGLRLFLRSPSFQVLLTFIVAVLAGGATLALRTIFADNAPFPYGGVRETVMLLVAPAAATALAAPLVFPAVQRIEATAPKRQEATS
ncbi:MAG: rod shape-determining protein MreD [Sandaracinus sp.]|nr:rod shape-determining protein MreD [Sandaracinus sp.]